MILYLLISFGFTNAQSESCNSLEDAENCETACIQILTNCMVGCLGDVLCEQNCFREQASCENGCPCHANCPHGCPCSSYDCTATTANTTLTPFFGPTGLLYKS